MTPKASPKIKNLSAQSTILSLSPEAVINQVFSDMKLFPGYSPDLDEPILNLITYHVDQKFNNNIKGGGSSRKREIIRSFSSQETAGAWESEIQASIEDIIKNGQELF